MKKQTDGKSFNSLKASLVTKAKKILVYGGQDEKDRRVIIDIIPSVVVTSLETDAFVAIRCLFPHAESERTQGSVVILKEKKRSRLCISRLRSNEFYSSASWRIGIERFGGTHLKFSGCTWYEIEFGKEKGNLEALSKKAHLMSEILARLVLRRNTLRKRHDKQIVLAK